MRTDAHAFFSEALFEATEESMWQQLAASYEGVLGAYLMPDAHSGYGVPVGCVIVTEDVILSHNLVQEETLVLPDGSTKRGFVHRKGATRAFPAGHPDLIGTAWEETGHPCLIPGSMYAGAAILFAQPGACASAFSVNHDRGGVKPSASWKRPKTLSIAKCVTWSASWAAS